MGHGTVGGLVAISEIEVSEEGVMEEALEDDVLVAGCAGVVDAAEAVGAAGGGGCVGGDIAGVVFYGVCEELIMFFLATWEMLGGVV